MKSDLDNKLHRIANIWNNFIWEYKLCSKEIKFSEDVKSNYFGDIIAYFQDTFDIIFVERNTKSKVDRFSYHISLLQAIFIQQDFVEELLIIFKCGLEKEDLKKDEDYSINRKIRNELVGHPINKTKNKSVLLSSTLYSYESDNDTIQYSRYLKNNNYKFEILTHKIADIILRHKQFLNRYFDTIINKLIGILKKYDKELTKLNCLIEKKDFETIIKLVGISYESIFNFDYIYDKDSLIKVYNRKSEHERYQNFIDKFYSDLKSGIVDAKNYIQELIEPKPILEKNELPKIEISFDSVKKKETFHYELEKLASKRNSIDFEFFSSLIKSKCSDNKLVMDELKHMENNIDDEIEYYTAFRLICKELNK